MFQTPRAEHSVRGSAARRFGCSRAPPRAAPDACAERASNETERTSRWPPRPEAHARRADEKGESREALPDSCATRVLRVTRDADVYFLRLYSIFIISEPPMLIVKTMLSASFHSDTLVIVVA